MDDLKTAICDAFCSRIAVSEFEGGYAIGTPYKNRSGDNIGIYAVESDGNTYRLIDNALTIAFLEAEGATLDNPSRRRALDDLLKEYGGADFDDEMGEIHLDYVKKDELARRILEFSALLLRINDLAWLSQEKVRGTFREDVRALLRKEFDGKAVIREDEPVSESLREVIPDMVIGAGERDPVALFIASDDSKIWQAMNLRLIADYEHNASLQVVAMLEREGAISRHVRQQADNRLDAIPRFEGEPNAAIKKVVMQVLGRQAVLH